MDVSPLVDGGRFPASCVQGEHLVVSANAFREGHDAMGVQAVLTDPQGGEQRLRMTSTNPGLDHWETSVRPETTGHWSFRIEAFSSPYDTWVHTAEVKIPAGLDVELVAAEGVAVLSRVLEEVEAGIPADLFQVLPGKGSVVGDRFVSHPDVRKIVFTGSTEVGTRVMAGAATAGPGGYL